MRKPPGYLIQRALLLLLAGAMTKSAQFPFHFWLPRAMAAPTPVSAYLHSATMVKAGIFLMARLWPVLSGTPEWFWIVTTAGLATMCVGAVVALFQDDLKGLLAYSTVSHLGLITMLLGFGTQAAAVAASSTSWRMRRSRRRCSWPPGSWTMPRTRGRSAACRGSAR